MKHVILAVGLALVLATRPAGAQTRVSVAIGFPAPRAYVSGVVVVGRPYGFYRARPRFYRPAPLFVERVYVNRRHHRHHCRYDRDYDDE
jgi:hypothetical protein